MSAPRDTPHEELRDDLSAYALGALPDEENAVLEAHLDDCAACRAELRWLAPAVDVLPASVEQREPPKRLKRELMSVVEREAAEERRAERADKPGVFGRLLGSAARPALALATVLLVLAGVGVGVLASQNGEGTDDGSPTTTIAAEGVGDDEGAGLRASLAVQDLADGGVLTVDEVDPVDRGHVYQLWVQRNGEFEPSSVFVPNGDGAASANVGQSLRGADAVLMTREPRGGSKQPTGSVFATIPLGT